MEFKQSAHSIYKTQYHIVFTTKFRKEILNPGFAKYTQDIITTVMDNMEGVYLLEINVQLDHVHMYVEIPPRYSVSKVVEVIKSRSAKLVRNKFKWIDKVYWGTSSLWSRGFFVSTVGINEKVIREYIRNQQKQDSGQVKLEL